jgi:hypothetical protein
MQVKNEFTNPGSNNSATMLPEKTTGKNFEPRRFSQWWSAGASNALP